MSKSALASGKLEGGLVYLVFDLIRENDAAVLLPIVMFVVDSHQDMLLLTREATTNHSTS